MLKKESKIKRPEKLKRTIYRPTMQDQQRLKPTVNTFHLSIKIIMNLKNLNLAI